MLEAAILDNRAFLQLAGHDARSFLQGLVTSDLRLLTPQRSLYGILLTPQGKFQFAFHIVLDADTTGNDETLLLEISANRLADLERRLMLYRMHASVTIEPLSPQPTVAIAFGKDAPTLAGLDATPGATVRESGLILQVEPRLVDFGIRLYGSAADIEAWLVKHSIRRVDTKLLERHRIALAIPETEMDLIVDKTMLLEVGLDRLGAVAFDKGCFVGQELTARTRYRGLIKRRLIPVELEDTDIEPGAPVMAGEHNAGVIRSIAGEVALAMLRLDRLDAPLRAGRGSVFLRPAAWQTDLAEQFTNATSAR